MLLLVAELVHMVAHKEALVAIRVEEGLQMEPPIKVMMAERMLVEVVAGVAVACLPAPCPLGCRSSWLPGNS